MMKMTKIDIFSGFLGAGKTTLIKKLIEEAYKGEKIVLIENEFGEIGIDGGFLKEAGVEINEMNSGCICCSLVGDFGKIRRKNIYTSDVTDQYYDLETRLLTKRELLKKLQGYLKNASNMDEILKIETKISDVTSELEVMQGQMNRLSKQISFSTITINAKLPANHTEEGFVFPDAKDGFRDFVSNLVEIF